MGEGKGIGSEGRRGVQGIGRLLFAAALLGVTTSVGNVAELYSGSIGMSVVLVDRWDMEAF